MDYIYPGCMSYVVKYVLWKFHRRTNAIRYLKSRTSKRSRRIIWQIVVRISVYITIVQCINRVCHHLYHASSFHGIQTEPQQLNFPVRLITNRLKCTIEKIDNLLITVEYLLIVCSIRRDRKGDVHRQQRAPAGGCRERQNRAGHPPTRQLLRRDQHPKHGKRWQPSYGFRSVGRVFRPVLSVEE